MEYAWQWFSYCFMYKNSPKFGELFNFASDVTLFLFHQNLVMLIGLMSIPVPQKAKVWLVWVRLRNVRYIKSTKRSIKESHFHCLVTGTYPEAK